MKRKQLKGAIRGPLRLRASVPSKHQEGNRQAYPEITLNDPTTNKLKDFPENALYTTKYTLWSFIPKLLFEQFRKATSIFFLAIVVITLIPAISPVSPYTSISGLTFILVVSAVREAYEDYQRLRADIKVNNKKYITLQPQTGAKQECLAYKIRVGDLVYVEAGNRIPVDMAVLASSSATGVVFMETAPLDGETNLKPVRCATPATQNLNNTQLSQLSGVLAAETPNHKLYQFRGSLELDTETEPVSLDEKNLLLAGSFLKNTEWAVGICIYAGPETKMGLNLKQPPSKFSHLDKKLNKYVIMIFAIDFLLCSAMTLLNYFFDVSHLAIAQQIVPEGRTFMASVGIFFSYTALLNYLIPLSLVVTIEMDRFFQARYISWDDQMRDGTKHAVAKTSNLNDELALVDYIFSDKTGTLTENLMTFKKASINGIVYDDHDGGALREQIEKQPLDNSEVDNIIEYCNILGLCHSVQVDPDKTTGELVYKAASPDEEALCKGAAHNGFVFKGREGGVIVLDVLGKETRYDLLCEMEFTSDRRRMSVIVRAPDGSIKVYSKGADSMIAERLADTPENKQLLEETYAHLERFSVRGLRTLLLAQKPLTEDFWENWRREWNRAANLIDGREEALAKVYEQIETDLILVGATAIEDKLQEGVPQTIASLKKAAIKIWVITGDKQETAINIGYSCKLLTQDMTVVKLNATSTDECGEKLTQYLEKHIRGNKTDQTLPVAVVVDGKTLHFILKDHREDFLELSTQCEAVICNRVAPLQKAEVVRLVAEGKDAVTLSIGDGGNDVSMIQQAHIGVGIQGREGSQAARASDFALPQFRHLQRLLTVHGRYSLLRNTKVIYYCFYKNIATFLCQIWFSLFSGYSGQTIFNDWVMTAFNMILTAAPIFFLGMFEKDLSEDVIAKHPEVYRDHKVLKFTSLMRWIGYAIMHSIVVFFVAYAMFYEDSIMLYGRNAGLWVFGTWTMSIAIFVVTAKVALETVHWIWLSHGSILVSLALYALLRVFLSVLIGFQPNEYGVFQALVQIPTFYACIVLCIVASLIPDFTFKYLKRSYVPKSWYLLQEKSKLAKESLKRGAETRPLLIPGEVSNPPSNEEEDYEDASPHYKPPRRTEDVIIQDA